MIACGERPSLREPFAVAAIWAVTVVATVVTYARLPVSELWNVSQSGIVGNRGRFLTRPRSPELPDRARRARAPARGPLAVDWRRRDRPLGGDRPPGSRPVGRPRHALDQRSARGRRRARRRSSRGRIRAWRARTASRARAARSSPPRARRRAPRRLGAVDRRVARVLRRRPVPRLEDRPGGRAPASCRRPPRVAPRPLRVSARGDGARALACRAPAQAVVAAQLAGGLPERDGRVRARERGRGRV